MEPFFRIFRKVRAKGTAPLAVNVTKLRLLHDKNIIKKVGDLFLQPFLHFKGNTNRQIHICLKNI